MRSLIQNERLKLYKRASTWVLTGIVVGLAALSLILQGAVMRLDFSSMVGPETESGTTQNWEQTYKDQLLSSYKTLKEDPKDGEARANAECYKYLLDNQIDPSHWKYGLVMEYRDDLFTLYDYEANPEDYDMGVADEADLKQRIEANRRLLAANDWKEYVRLQIKEVQDGAGTPAEKQVQTDIWNMYLELNIPPVTNDEAFAFDGFPTDQQVTITWQQQELRDLRDNKLALLRNESSYGTVLTASDKARLEDQIALSTERLKTDTPPTEETSLYGMMESSLSSLNMLSILLIVLAGGIIANEYTNGTIKLLLITPHKRQSVFWAKVLILLEITLIATGAMFVLNFLISGIFGGFSGIGDMYMTPLFGHIVRLPYILVIVYKYLLFLLPVFAYGALALMLSAVTRKAAAAMAVAILLMYGGSFITSILSMLSEAFVVPGIRFLLFTNTDLSVYFQAPAGSLMELAGQFTTLPDPAMNLIFSVVVLIVYTVCFMWIARDSFCRRDVK